MCVCVTCTRCSTHIAHVKINVHMYIHMHVHMYIHIHTCMCVCSAAAQAAQLDFDGETVAAPYSYVEFTKCIKSRSWEIFNARWVSSSDSASLHALFDRVPFNRRHIVGDPSTARQMARCGHTSSNELSWTCSS